VHHGDAQLRQYNVIGQQELRVVPGLAVDEERRLDVRLVGAVRHCRVEDLAGCDECNAVVAQRDELEASKV
jgi:hypothetical protein